MTEPWSVVDVTVINACNYSSIKDVLYREVPFIRFQECSQEIEDLKAFKQAIGKRYSEEFISSKNFGFLCFVTEVYTNYTLYNINDLFCCDRIVMTD